MSNSTLLSQALIERLDNQSSDRESRFIAAQDNARAFGQQMTAVLAGYDFIRDDANCLLLADGTPVQAAMLLTNKGTGESLSVIRRLDDTGNYIWLVLDTNYAPYEADVFIRVVEDRIAANHLAAKRCMAN
ncbi:MAG: hypothetical protein ACRYFS_21160 [Janthinobacterium lividum]